MKKVKKPICKQYVGITCVNGYCPNALSNYDMERDDDAYAWAHLDKPIKCTECIYNNGCEDCALWNTQECSHEIDSVDVIKN